MRDTSQLVKEAVLEAVENQLRDDSPPEARITLERLLAAGYLREEAMTLLGCAVAAEIFEGLALKKPYDEARYVEFLSKLPGLPGEHE